MNDPPPPLPHAPPHEGEVYLDARQREPRDSLSDMGERGVRRARYKRSSYSAFVPAWPWYTVSSSAPLRFVAALLSDRRRTRPSAIFTQQFAVRLFRLAFPDGNEYASQFSPFGLDLPRNVALSRGVSLESHALERDYSKRTLFDH